MQNYIDKFYNQNYALPLTLSSQVIQAAETKLSLTKSLNAPLSQVNVESDSGLDQNTVLIGDSYQNPYTKEKIIFVHRPTDLRDHSNFHSIDKFKSTVIVTNTLNGVTQQQALGELKHIKGYLSLPMILGSHGKGNNKNT